MLNYDAVTPFQQKSISTANSPCEQNVLGLSLSLSAVSSPVFRGCTEREREKAHNRLGYAHLFQPDNGWTAAKIHAYVYSTRRGYFQRTDFLRLFVVAFRGGEHFWYRLLAIIPLLTLNALSLSLFSYSSLVWEDNRGERRFCFVIAIKFLLFRMILFSMTIISVKGNELNSEILVMKWINKACLDIYMYVCVCCIINVISRSTWKSFVDWKFFSRKKIWFAKFW